MKRTLNIFVAFAILAVASAAHAGQRDPTTRPLLDELNRQTTQLYQQVQSGIYHVQLPQPHWISAYAMAGMDHWTKDLDPATKARLEEQPAWPIQVAEVRLADEAPLPVSATRPSNEMTTIPGQGTYIMVHPRDATPADRDPLLGGTLHPRFKPPGGFEPSNIGLLLDGQGHLLVPLYVERETVGPAAVKLCGADGKMTTARFVGSDRQTNLTLLQVDKPTGEPVKLADKRPDAGSLVLCLSSTDGSGRLGIWTDGSAENGIIVDTGGQVCGIARYGQFLSGSACTLIARQLIQYGAVKRATLGVLVTEIRQDDPLRRQQPVLGNRSAMRIDQVMDGSKAQKAGLRAGDLVLEIAGEPVSDLPSFAAAIAARNGRTELRILRDQNTQTLTVELEQQK